MFIVGLLECFFLVNKNLVRASSCGILVAVNRQTDTARPGALATALRRLCCRAGVDAAAPPPRPLLGRLKGTRTRTRPAGFSFLLWDNATTQTHGWFFISSLGISVDDGL